VGKSTFAAGAYGRKSCCIQKLFRDTRERRSSWSLAVPARPEQPDAFGIVVGLPVNSVLEFQATCLTSVRWGHGLAERDSKRVATWATALLAAPDVVEDRVTAAKVGVAVIDAARP